LLLKWSQPRPPLIEDGTQYFQRYRLRWFHPLDALPLVHFQADRFDSRRPLGGMRECLSKGNLAGDKIAPAATLVWAKRQEVSERDQDLKESSALTADRSADVSAGLADGWRPV